MVKVEPLRTIVNILFIRPFSSCIEKKKHFTGFVLIFLRIFLFLCLILSWKWYTFVGCNAVISCILRTIRKSLRESHTVWVLVWLQFSLAAFFSDYWYKGNIQNNFICEYTTARRYTLASHAEQVSYLWLFPFGYLDECWVADYSLVAGSWDIEGSYPDLIDGRIRKGGRLYRFLGFEFIWWKRFYFASTSYSVININLTYLYSKVQ